MIGNNRKGNALCGEPDGPILPQEIVLLDVHQILFQSLRKDALFVLRSVDPCLDEIRGREPHDGCRNEIVKEHLFDGDGGGLGGSEQQWKDTAVFDVGHETHKDSTVQDVCKVSPSLPVDAVGILVELLGD